MSRLHPVSHKPIHLLTSSCASHEHVCGSANVPGTYTQCDWLFSPARALVQFYTEPDSHSKSVRKRMSFTNSKWNRMCTLTHMFKEIVQPKMVVLPYVVPNLFFFCRTQKEKFWRIIPVTFFHSFIIDGCQGFKTSKSTIKVANMRVNKVSKWWQIFIFLSGWTVPLRLCFDCILNELHIISI